MEGGLTMRQLADCLEAVDELIHTMECESPKRHEELESMRDTRKRIKYLLRQAVSRSNSEGSKTWQPAA